MNFDLKRVIVPVLAISLAAAWLSSGGRSAFAQPGAPVIFAGDPVEPRLSRPVRELPVTGARPDAVVRDPVRTPANNAADLLFDFEGLGGDGYAPPDPVGDVGPDHYVQTVNISFAVYDKNGSLLTGPTRVYELFSESGEYCQDGDEDGSPGVVYDALADRWVLSQYSWSDLTLNILCVAVSKTADPTGEYYLYEFTLPDYADYPRIGVWTDAYYVGTYTGLANFYYAHALDRAKMLAGLPATVQSIGSQPNYLMPADFDGPNAPPPNAPGYFYTIFKSGYPDHPPGVDRIEVYEFDVDWDDPGNSTFGSVDTIPISAFNYTVCGFKELACIPQPGTSMKLESFSNWPMWRLAYRNLGDYEAMVGNFTIDLDGTEHAAIRWFELHNSPAGWELFQEGTHAPDEDHRFMGSIAMDGSGNIALGYSLSSEVTKPSIRYATRLVTDPHGTLQTEASVIDGSGVQTGFPFYGHHSSLVVDPVDECSFWFTAEYHDVDNTGLDWNTRVGIFKIPTCSGGFEPDFTIDAGPDNLAVCIPDDAVYTVTVGSVLGYSDPVTLSVHGIPVGTTTGLSINPVVPPGVSMLTIGNTSAASPGVYPIDVVGNGSSTTYTSTVSLSLNTPVVGAPALVSPGNGSSGVSVNPVFSWSAVSQAESYALEIALDPGFTNLVYSAAGITGLSHQPGTTLAESTTYHWRVRASNICGAGNYSDVFSLTTAELPPILLVDDDDDNPNVRTFWTGALNALGLDYDIWGTGAEDAEPGPAFLSNYETVIWFTGARFGAAGPSPSTESALANWLDGGGCFFISSQDYHEDKGTTGFMTDYLGVQAVDDDQGLYTSVSGENLLSGLGPFTLSFPYDEFTDKLTAGNGGQVVMIGENGHEAGVTKESGSYKTMYWAFGLEALPTGGRSAALEAFVDWCQGITPSDFDIYLPVIKQDP